MAEHDDHFPPAAAHALEAKLRGMGKDATLTVDAGTGHAFMGLRYTLKVPNGLAFSDFRGYEDWQVVAPSQTDAQNVMRVILANPVMMKAYRTGIPAKGKPFPDGSKIAKIEWQQRKITDAPFSATTPDTVPGPLLRLNSSRRMPSDSVSHVRTLASNAF